MKNYSNESYGLNLMQLLQALWQRAWVIALAAIVGAVAMFSYATFIVTPKYDAEVLMYVNNSSLSQGSGNAYAISNSELSAAQSLVDTYIIILNSRTTLEKVTEEADLDYSYSKLKSMLRAEAVNGTEVFRVKVTTKDPAESVLIANTIGNVLPKSIADVVDGSDVRIVDYAGVSSEKSSPNENMYAAVGFLAGFAIMCLIIAIQTTTDTLIHNEDYLLENYDLPVLAVVPDLVNAKGNGYYRSYKKTENGEENK